MSLEELRERLPDYAKDIRLNLGTLAGETTLSEQQKLGAFLACALATRNPHLIRGIAAFVADRLSPVAVHAAKAAAVIMGMNNVYYRATHLMQASEYRSMPAKLRMNVIANPGVDKVDFELWCLAVSAIAGCGACLDSHEKAVRKAGLTPEQAQAALRIAASLQAAAVALDAEDALT